MVFPVLFIEFYHRWGENEEYEYQRYASNTLNDFRHHSAPKNNNKNPTRSGKESKSILNSNNTALTGKDKRVIHSTDDPKLVVRQTTLYQKVNEFKTSF
ncbi:hypothetical protein LSH36_1126g00031 [Paralvinella palmiformis]|uniref:Uncharacterized protein n=1 Tax=Paralvinella palmiformis TaxID=53620 RepID=A0AAD9MSE4_9ANNE|nr:hypothetical protein LSH36_1126g00031 [Paralvinella palmiformis]